MDDHIFNERSGPYTPVVDPVKDSGGALLELFLAGRMPDGAPLSELQIRELGSGLYELYQSAEKGKQEE